MASSQMILFDSIAQSNIPRGQKSAMMRALDKYTNGRASDYLDSVRDGSGIRGHHMEQGMSVLRSGLESGAVGALLGAVHAEVGLDQGFLALDAALAVAGYAGSIFLSNHVAGDFQNVGNSSLGVYAFRMAYRLRAEKAIASGRQPAGMFVKGSATKIAGDEWAGDDMGEDPIVAAAKNL